GVYLRHQPHLFYSAALSDLCRHRSRRQPPSGSRRSWRAGDWTRVNYLFTSARRDTAPGAFTATDNRPDWRAALRALDNDDTPRGPRSRRLHGYGRVDSRRNCEPPAAGRMDHGPRHDPV